VERDPFSYVETDRRVRSGLVTVSCSTGDAALRQRLRRFVAQHGFDGWDRARVVRPILEEFAVSPGVGGLRLNAHPKAVVDVRGDSVIPYRAEQRKRTNLWIIGSLVSLVDSKLAAGLTPHNHAWTQHEGRISLSPLELDRNAALERRKLRPNPDTD
jgi:hypothetical protein